jgi:hypothetical protein
MIIGSGYDYSVGGAQGAGYTGGSLPYLSAYATEGVSLEKRMSWSTVTQEKWLQNFNRTEAQQNYATDSPQAYAYQYVNTIDTITDPTTYTDPIVDFGRSTFTPSRTLILGALVALYLTR